MTDLDRGGAPSPWWSDGAHDPWRDPRTVAVVVLPPPEPPTASPPLPPVPAGAPLPPPAGRPWPAPGSAPVPPPPASPIPASPIDASSLAPAAGPAAQSFPPGLSSTPHPPDGPAPGGTRRAGLTPGLLVAVVVAVGLLAGTVGAAFGHLAARRAAGPPLGDRTAVTAPPRGIAATVAAVRPSVVTVEVADLGGASVGSGFVVAADGYVVTNQHVLGAGTGPVSVTFLDGTVSPARIVGRDEEADIAVLKVAGRPDLTPVRLGDSEALSVGDPVLAFGSPLSLTDTVTSGIVSAVDRPLRTGGEDGEQVRYYAAIQTDAAVNQGNSGGPLVDGAGRVVGVNAVIQSLGGRREEAGNIGLAFAIPINQAQRMAREIIATGRAKRTVFGAEVSDAGVRGVRLGSVAGRGPAAGAGLRAGDVVTRFDGRALDGAVDLIALVRKHAPGEAVAVTYQRGGGDHTVSVRLAADAR